MSRKGRSRDVGGFLVDDSDQLYIFLIKGNQGNEIK